MHQTLCLYENISLPLDYLLMIYSPQWAPFLNEQHHTIDPFSSSPNSFATAPSHLSSSPLQSLMPDIMDIGSQSLASTSLSQHFPVCMINPTSFWYLIVWSHSRRKMSTIILLMALSLAWLITLTLKCHRRWHCILAWKHQLTRNSLMRYR